MPDSRAGNGVGERHELENTGTGVEGVRRRRRVAGNGTKQTDQIAQGLGKENEFYFLWLNMY